MEFPKEFTDRMRSLLGDESLAFFASMEEEPVRSFRINTLKCEERELVEALGKEQISFCSEGYIFDMEHIGAHPYHHAGGIYVQEPAAMAVAECTPIEPGMKVLDLCASPGGKSTQAAAKLCGEGVIISNEIDKQRCRTLRGNIERMGIRNAIVTNASSDEIGGFYKDFFDLVIVDAPCSGEGMMRKNPLAVSEWSVENINRCAERQREILDNICGSVKVGGRLLYSTCTFAPEENEMQIASFLVRHPEYKLIPVSERVREVSRDGIADFGEGMRLCRRFYPHEYKGEGQFMALLLRAGAEDEPPLRGRRTEGKREAPRKEERAEIEAVRAFIEQVLTPDGVREAEKYSLMKQGEEIWLIPDLPCPERCGIFFPGVAVGHVQKGRVVPHHNFFTAYGSFFKNTVNLSADDVRTRAYLHGESIKAECDNGYAAVLCDGMSLGGAKVSSGEAKNHYPKGLRI